MKNFTYVRRKAIFLSLFLSLFSFFSYSQLVPKSLTASNGVFIGFYEYKPVDYDATGNYKYPVIVFLHGIGERGNGTTDLPNVLGNGTPYNIKSGHNMRFFWNGKWETFLVLIPQLSTNYGSWQNFYTDEMIKYAKQNLNIDPNRIFLAGLSLGGGGTWKYAASSLTNAQNLAAIAVACGTCENVNWCNIANAKLPVWAFHAEDDGTVPAGCTSGTIQGINSCNPAVKPYQTMWATGQHWIWGRVYSTGYDAQHPNIYEWFLGQDKSKPVNIRPVANAGANISITTGLGVATLNASGSTDADGTIQRYVWEKVSGPSFGALSTPISLNGLCAVTGLLLPGTYVYKVTVIDDRADWTTATVTVTVTTGPPPTGNLPPVAAAGNDITITLPVNSATLNGTGSYDPGGAVSTYSWTYVSGGGYNISNANTASATLTNLVEGTYVFRLTVTDNGGLTATDDVQVIVNPAGSAPPPPPPPPPVNQAPAANAGGDVTITLPTSNTELDGSASTDNDGTINTWEWTRVSGPTQYTIGNSAVAKTTLTNLVQGTYVFKLRVWDNNWAPAEDLVTVKVNASTAPPPNQPPVARAGNDITITLPVNNTSLNGSTSTDPDGTISAYSWTKIGGPAQFTLTNGNAATATLTNLDEGTYSFRLVVTDNGGSTDDDTLQVIVHPVPAPVNQPPAARAGNDITITLPVDSTILNGNTSTDPENAIAAWSWTQVSGPSQYAIADPNATSTVLRNLVQGTYSFRLLVTDNGGLWDDDTVVITVNPTPSTNLPPVAHAGNYTTITLPVNNSTLNGSASADPDGTIATYAWTKITGPAQYNIANAAAASTSITNLAEGVYTFRLLVTDNGGLTDDDTVVVAVNAAPPPTNQPAVAIARPDTTITLPANSLTLNGSASYDPDGVIKGYEWLRIAGPSQYTLGNNNAAITTLSNLVQGTYTFRLRVWDSYWVPADDTITITINPEPNVAPVANAGTDVTITWPTNSVVLNGTASSDANNNIVSYSWTKLDGPASYHIASANAASTTVDNLVAGVYTFRLQVTDAGGVSDADTVTITVHPAPNVPPVARAGEDIIISLPANSATLNGTASTDADGTITTWSWTKISGPASYNIVDASAATTVLSNLAVGTYRFRLQVTDNSNASDADTIIVVVNPAPNTPPVANAGDDITITLPIDNTILNGSTSIDLDGLITAYAWSYVSGPAQYHFANAAAAATTLTNLVQGTYIFRLVVTDNGGLTSEDLVTVTVNATPPPPNHAPVAKAGADISITLPTNSTDLNGSASTDPDNNIVSYEWAIISGPGQYNMTNATSATAQLSALVQGTYVFRLVVTDAGGLSSADTMQVTVLRPPNVAPVAHAGGDFTVTLPNSINLNGSASHDPDGTIASYSWVKVSGTGATTIVNAATATPTVVGAQPGDYVFELTVTDNEGATGTDRVTVTVLPAPNVNPVANAGKDSTIAVPATTAWLLGNESYDPDGTIIQYTWKFVSGPAAAIIASPNNVMTLVSHLTTGDYTFELIVADNKGATARDTVRMTVVNNFRYEEKLHVFPNPTNGSSTINVRCISDTLGATKILVYNGNGILMKTMHSFKSQSYFQMPVDVTAFPAGLYIIEVNIDNKKQMLTKFIKR
jgi:predicted esterase